MSETDPTVFVVDDDESIRRSTERLLRAEGFCVKSFGSARAFLDEATILGPSCLVLDVHLPGLSGLDLQSELARSGVQIPIIFISGRGSIPMTVRAMKAGAVEFLTKPVSSTQLLAAIRAGIEQDRSIQRAREETAGTLRRFESLTPREREVLTLVVAGLLNKQIASELSMAERTVKFHRAHVMEKMRADSLADLVRMASQIGISPPDRSPRNEA